MRPNFDVLIIGGGPAGVAAAIRSRWVKRYHVVPCKVGVIEPSTLGGLTQMGACFITGPGWAYNSESIKPALLDDFHRLEIPHIRDRAVSVQRKDSIFTVTLGNGEQLTSWCVVVACGMKMLTKEPELYGKGVTSTIMGVEWTVEKIRGWVGEGGGPTSGRRSRRGGPQIPTGSRRKVVFVGSHKMANMMPMIDECKEESVEVIYVIEPVIGVDRAVPERKDVIVGTIIDMKSDEQVVTATIEKPDGTRMTISDIYLLVTDFMSYELSPSRGVRCEGVKLDDNGFIAVDRRQRTNVEGLLAAGDTVGMPSCVARAIGEGTVAGFEAYRFVYRQKFRADPPLFAYYGYDIELYEGFHELPELMPGTTYSAELLQDMDHVLKLAVPKFLPFEQPKAEKTVRAIAADPDMNLEGIGAVTEQSPDELRYFIEKLLEFKLVTIHRV